MAFQDFDVLSELLATPSPSGFELPGQRIWAHYARQVADLVDSDHYGNTWAVRNGADKTAPRVMFGAHADEIGFMVNHITDKGFLHITRIGGSDAALARGRRVTVYGDQGAVPGVIGITAIHLRDRKEEKVPDWHEMTIDVGASSKEEVEALGLRVGHPAVFSEAAGMMGDQRLVGRALDNRIGGFIVARVLHALAEGDSHQATVISMNSVQEEIGGNGARMVTYRLEPSVAVILDVTHATDTPGIDASKHGKVQLGEGPSLTHGTANHPLVVQRLMEVADEEGIPVQHEASSRYTGTDTDEVFTSRRGVPSALVSLPMRYMHSPVETVDIADVEACIALLTAFARSVTSADTFRHTL